MKKIYLFLIILLLIGSVNAAACMTKSQVQSERTKCLYIYESKVYWYKSYSNSHYSHSCGSDVTSVMRSTHVSNPNKYLIPYYLTDLCPDCVPTTEICDNIDNNCNGQIDEGLSKTSSCGNGACLRTITQTCSGGNWNPSCTPGNPVTETCNNIDDDCDNIIDNNIPPIATNCGVGECSSTGQRTCSNGNLVDSCVPKSPSNEICDGKDNDCNGQVDETCPCQNNQQQECGSSIGECEKGMQTCSNGVWGNCVGEVGSSPETCDGLDNDCDGKIDEGLISCSSSNSCTSSWNCGSWSDCSNGISTRTCSDINNCSIQKNIPVLSKNCTVISSNNIENQTEVNVNNTNMSVNSTEEDIEDDIYEDSEDYSSDLSEEESISENSISKTNTNEKSITEASKVMWFIGRTTGMFAFLFLALSILGALYKFKYHKYISYTAFFLVIVHLIGLINDKFMWKDLNLFNSLVPLFGTSTENYISYGIIAFYLMFIGILGCLFFKFLIRNIGMKKWTWIHRLTVPAYILVYIHAWKIGTDFNNFIYHSISIILFILIIIGYFLKIMKKPLLQKEPSLNENKVNNVNNKGFNFSINEYWFKPRKSLINSNWNGIGFIPISFEGVLTLIIFIGLIILSGYYFEILKSNINNIIFFFMSIIVLFVLFLIISKNTTEKYKEQ